ncbi:adenylyltransferase/cytidyltransferase family protein [Candidatus Paracaedibacter symbiosus]|uniref:adenylyltransferase/cytidyltransferase family protein n=1 Tax=Candidatus Paracaedibacter symbiosus TaxID=244582 RepID=UPI00068B134B|nr:adenylyltransferase/cytidyltransferase family protein [Candidatus Paracaedibacter symbiosus]
MDNKIFRYPQDPLPPILGTKVLVGGCFDLLHYGHLSFFKAAKKLGDNLIISLEPDLTIRRLKQASPIHTQNQRAEILSELLCTDYILLLPELHNYDDYLMLVKTVKPDFLAVTKGDPQTVNKQKQALEIGALVIEVNQVIEGLSSSLIRRNHL